MSNPLLSKDSLPLFNQIQAEHIQPAIDDILSTNRQKINELLNNKKNYSWATLVEPLEKLENDLGCAWSTVSHLNSVKDTPEFREAHDAALSKITDYSTEMGQNEALYEAYQMIAKSEDYANFNYAQKKVIENELRDFKLSGVGLSKDKKEHFKLLRKKLTELESQFEHNVLDATEGWELLITDIEKLKGMPSHALESTQKAASDKGLQGWLISLDFSTYHAVVSYAENRALRKQVYEANVTRASEVGPNAGKWDNSQVMEEILKIRQELAIILDFNNFAEYSLATKMAKNTDTVLEFLLNLAKRSKPQALKELDELKQFGLKKYGINQLEAWDTSFLSEQLCKEKFTISQEELRPYFPENKVLNGLYTIVNRLFGITIQEEHQFEKWHDTVRLFRVFDEKNKLRGQFYIDLYIRPHKRQGAWVAECRDRVSLNGTLQTPVAYLVTNFTPAELGKPALLTHDDVTTLFHEFGHCLHHVLTQIDYSSVSGTHVEWDAVELPSQLLENWCWESDALELISAHYQTGEVLPKAIINKLKEAKNFLSAMFMVRQLEFSLFDFQIHLQKNMSSAQQIQTIIEDVRKTVSVMSPPPFNRFQHTFTHIFGGSYAAGYYSYKWAEVLSSDVYEEFEKHGIFNAKIGHKLLSCILEQGGAKDAMALFVEFKGREPQVDALLRHSGL